MPSPNPNDITPLIGTDFPKVLLNFAFSCGRDHEPYAVRTKLGWVLMGGKTLKRKTVNVNATEILPDIERFWQIESYGTLSKTDSILMTKDEERVTKHTRKHNYS